MFKLKIIDFLKFVSALFLASIIRLLEIDYDIWIVTERPNECKDNGYHFFKYMRENHPRKKVYYAIEKNSIHSEKINSLGNIICYNSFKHYLFSLLATRLIGAFFPVGIPDSISFYKFNRLIRAKKVFLQHGITKEKVKSLFYNTTQVNLFSCGALPEYNFVSNCFGYPKGLVKYLGFCRYDNLAVFETQKQILIMPTWRQSLPSQTFSKKMSFQTSVYEKQFLKSDYYKHYSRLISNQNLHEFLEHHGYKLVFYLHHELQQFVSLFKNNHKNIVLANNKQYDVQQLLKESEFLITDYSSIAFDFAYMNKPLVYFQFDEEAYYKSHYTKGYFEYETMGFGPKVKDSDKLIASIFYSFDTESNMFVNQEKYSQRSHDFFKIKDRSNCKRTYEAIVDL
jgi:CDP-glycerol glycerophosphotransferase